MSSHMFLVNEITTLDMTLFVRINIVKILNINPIMLVNKYYIVLFRKYFQELLVFVLYQYNHGKIWCYLEIPLGIPSRNSDYNLHHVEVLCLFCYVKIFTLKYNTKGIALCNNRV